jgi:hypothetical protein
MVDMPGIVDGPTNVTQNRVSSMPTIKQGWEYVAGANPNDPNAMVRNTQTGQMVTQSHPTYTNYQAPSGTGDFGNDVVGTAVSGPITTQQQVGSTTAPVGGSINQGAPATVAQSFQQALVNRLNPQSISAQSPEVAGAIQANNLSEQRAFSRDRNMLAERAAAQGFNNGGGFETGLSGLAQNRAQREGQFAGSAIQQAQRDQDMNTRSAMAQAAGLLSGNANLSQQQQLAELDAALRREGLGAQTALGNRDIDLRSRLGEGQLNLGLLTALLGNDQFGRSLAQQGAQFGAGLDQSGLLALLGGL